VLTQSIGRLEGLGRELENRGYRVTRQPLIETQVLLDDTTRTKASKLLECKWILFTSRTSAEVWPQLIPSPITHHPSPKFAAVGQKTAQTLTSLGISVSLIADKQNAETFAEMFLNHPEAASPVGLPQGDRALNTVQTTLEQHGFYVYPVVMYKTILNPQNISGADIIVLASPSAVEALEDYGTAKLLAIGETTARAIAARGWKAFHSSSPDQASILEMIEGLSKGEMT
jgi:uroporphyrinogen-III synthase